MLLAGGWIGNLFMIALGLLSLAAVTVAIERAFNTRREKVIPAGFLGELQELVRRDDTRPDLFRETCGRWTAPIATILQAGLIRCGRPVVEVEKSMEDAAARELAAIRGGIRPLNVIGNVAPLVGLLGTVVGMIIAFRVASQAGLGKGEMLAQGIYLALVTTAIGLMIAIPSILAAAVFNSRIEKYFREIDEQLMNTMPCFARMEQSPVAHASSPPRPKNPLIASSAAAGS
jgi:biopolymer transport protein ExbB